jgi:5-methylcytosine-specific restriction endonuclease McrA
MIKTGKLGIVRCTGKDLAQLKLACKNRDGWTCVECGRRVSDGVHECNPHRAHAAHIVGLGRGGSDVISNLRTLCAICHLVNEHNPKSVPAKERHEQI